MTSNVLTPLSICFKLIILKATGYTFRCQPQIRLRWLLIRYILFNRNNLIFCISRPHIFTALTFPCLFTRGWINLQFPRTPFKKMDYIQSQHGLVIICRTNCKVKLLIHSQTNLNVCIADFLWMDNLFLPTFYKRRNYLSMSDRHRINRLLLPWYATNYDQSLKKLRPRQNVYHLADGISHLHLIQWKSLNFKMKFPWDMFR